MGGKNGKHQIQTEINCQKVCCLFPFTNYKRFFLYGMSSGYGILPFALPFNDLKLLTPTAQNPFHLDDNCECCNSFVKHSLW